MKPLKKGILIALEGVDGSGKSTLCTSLYNHYSTIYATLHTKEPGGSQLGSVLRSHLQQQKIPTCSQAEFLLFAADRAQHFHEIIIPALQNKTLIFSDRLSDSSLVYQGYGRGLDVDFITTVNRWAMQSVQPDLTLYVQVSRDVAFERLQSRNQKLTAFEQNRSFFEKIITGFDTLYAQRNDVVILDGNQSKEELMHAACNSVETFLAGF